jgi:hypothetical protein
MRGDAPRLARSDLAGLVADRESEGAEQDHPQLLVLVAVLGDGGARLELDVG